VKLSEAATRNFESSASAEPVSGRSHKRPIQVAKKIRTDFIRLIFATSIPVRKV
jgi:hypothetical protein